MKFKTLTLGCKVNFYESNAIEASFKKLNYEKDENNPDVIVVNTCSVTSVADQKSRQIIRRERRKHPKAIIAVMGCYSQKNAQYVLDECKANIVIGTSYRNKIIELIEQFIIDKKNIILINNDVRHLLYESFSVFPSHENVRAYVKIQDGCNNFCTYCTIPYTRGTSRSRNKDEIIAEIKYLIDQGYKEIVLTGIHTAHYGLDLKDTSFSDLVEEIVNLKGLYRLRISSIEESEIDDKFIDLLAKYPNIANHLHIPLQSGSASILKRMNRKYNVDDYVNKIKRIREVRPDIAITTDVIVGFPGEREKEFLETYDFIKKIDYAELHVFPFSAREGTAAYNFKDQVDASIKSIRVKKLLTLSNELMKKYRDKFIGQELEVILEERNKDSHNLTGFSSNYLKLEANLSDDYIGKIAKIKVS